MPAVLVVIWLALCGVVVAASVEIVKAGADEAVYLMPPIYAVLAAVGTGLVIDIRSRFLGRGPSVGRIANAVVVGAIVAPIVGFGLAFVLAIAPLVPLVLIAGDMSDWGPVPMAVYTLVILFVIYALPVILGAYIVLYDVFDWTLPFRRRGRLDKRATGAPTGGN